MLILTILFTISGLVLAGFSVPLILGKIPPNGLYGFRVKKTLNNPEIWYPVNAYAGKCLLTASLGLILAAIVLTAIPGIAIDIYSYCILGVWLTLFILVLAATIRYMNSLVR